MKTPKRNQNDKIDVSFDDEEFLSIHEKLFENPNLE